MWMKNVWSGSTLMISKDGIEFKGTVHLLGLIQYEPRHVISNNVAF